MEKATLLLAMLVSLTSNAQLANKQYNQGHGRFNSGQEDITAFENKISIITKVLYNAVPDGYHITFTKSFIGKSVDEVELQMNTITANLIKEVGVLGITKKDAVVDIISLDPIFNIRLEEPAENVPMGYKVTENVTFNIKSISTIGALSKKCLDFGIYDLINTEAYLFDSKSIYDSLANKATEILEAKKKTSSRIGWAFTGGTATFNEINEVIYPSERYLKAYAGNAGLYQHHVSQNTSIRVDRTLDVDNYFNLNMKDADYVFHSEKTLPVIQFYYQLNYAYTRKDTEQEKDKKENLEKPERIFYILDKTGNLKKIEM